MNTNVLNNIYLNSICKTFKSIPSCALKRSTLTVETGNNSQVAVFICSFSLITKDFPGGKINLINYNYMFLLELELNSDSLVIRQPRSLRRSVAKKLYP